MQDCTARGACNDGRDGAAGCRGCRGPGKMPRGSSCFPAVELVIAFNLDDASMWAMIEPAECSGTVWFVNNAGSPGHQPFAGIQVATPPLLT